MIALPICTAPPLIASDSSVSSSDENVAPWMPSRPVRPPTATIRSPGLAAFSVRPTGISPTVPQNTSGLARYRSSNTRAPLTVGMPIRLP